MEWSSCAERTESIDKLKGLNGDDSHSIFIQGAMVQVKRSLKSRSKKKPVYRGTIKGFSQKSRFNLLKRIARIDWPMLRHGWFVTLTYPDRQASVTLATATDQRWKFVQRLEKHLSEKLLILWRKELQVRKSGVFEGIGVPHWHLCIFTEQDLDNWSTNLFWSEVIKAEQFVQTKVQWMNSGQHAAFYCAKYLTEEKQSGILDNAPYLASPGRAWGWMHKDKLPMCPSELHLGIETDKWQRLMEQLGALWPQIATQEMESFTLIGPNAEEAKKIIAEILGLQCIDTVATIHGSRGGTRGPRADPEE